MKSNSSQWIHQLILLIVCSSMQLVFISCDKEPEVSRDELIQNEIAKRIKQFTQARSMECISNTMEKAIQMTDSIMKLNAVKYIADDLHRPTLPNKPPRSLKPVPMDSIRNQPFLKDSSFIINPKDTVVH